jgi:hypothetical protein
MAAVFDERGASPRFRSDVSKVVSSGGFDDVDAAKGGVDLVVEADASLTKVVVAEAGSAEGVTEDGGVGKGREDEKIGAAGGIGEGCDVGGGGLGLLGARQRPRARYRRGQWEDGVFGGGVVDVEG